MIYYHSSFSSPSPSSSFSTYNPYIIGGTWKARRFNLFSVAQLLYCRPRKYLCICLFLIPLIFLLWEKLSDDSIPQSCTSFSLNVFVMFLMWYLELCIFIKFIWAWSQIPAWWSYPPKLDFKNLLLRTFILFLWICPMLSVCLAMYEDVNDTVSK